MSTIASSVLVLIAIGGPTVFANLGLRHGWARVVSYVWIGVLAAGSVLLGLSVLAILALSSAQHQALNAQVPPAVFVGAAVVLTLMVPAAMVAVFTPSLRLWLARRIPFEPGNPVHVVALALLAISFVTALLQQVLLTGIPAFANQVFGSANYTSLDIVVGELPFVVIGFLGVGLFVRRDFGQSLRRLGLVRPTWGQLALGLAAAGALYLASDGLERLGASLMPGVSQQLAQNTRSLFGHLTDPVSALIVGLSAGVGEEILFRGALQQRLGIVSTAILFGVVHLNYGVSLTLLSVVLVAVALAVLRRYANTTTTIVTHATLDVIALGVSGWLAYPLTIAMTVVLGGIALLALRRSRGEPTGAVTSSEPAAL
ncbi:MAG: CPBP family intramembrane metalloprotease [Candidatus Dormibacteraeota bacterium]|nr:CPBP family intramembrane metalloprotease [Candidatus Dormibacteraeota bacterium]